MVAPWKFVTKSSPCCTEYKSSLINYLYNIVSWIYRSGIPHSQKKKKKGLEYLVTISSKYIVCNLNHSKIILYIWPFLKEKTRNGGMKRGWDLLGGEGEQIS